MKKNSSRAVVAASVAVASVAVASGALLLAGGSSAFAADGALASVHVFGSNPTAFEGTNNSVLGVSAPAPCDAAATRHVTKITAVTATSPADQSEADKWVGDNFYSPTGLQLPGPLTYGASLSWQQIANNGAQAIVPGVYEFELRCQNLSGTVISNAWSGSVTFDTATHWTSNTVPQSGIETTTSVAVSPQPVTAGQNVTLTATVSEADAAAPTGDVEFSVNGQVVGTAAVDASGVASYTGTFPAGNHSVVARYVGDADFRESSSTATAFAVDAAPASTTTTTLAVSPTSGPANQQVTFSGAVANSVNPAAIPAGVCEFFDSATLLGQSPVDASGDCSFMSTAFSGAGHEFRAAFVPADSSLFVGSSSAVVAADYDSVLYEPAEGSIVVTVPAGNLTIFTPYTPASPLNLGEMVLAADGSSFSASAPFNKVSVTDTRSGNPGWSASLARADFVGANPADTIAAAHSGFENVTAGFIPGNAITTLGVFELPANDPSYAPGPQQFARALPGAGTGTVDIVADFVLEEVPTSTKAGSYTTTVTFTVA